jgi:hypothetical protein
MRKGASGEVAKVGDITRTAKLKVYKSGFFYSVVGKTNEEGEKSVVELKNISPVSK